MNAAINASAFSRLQTKERILVRSKQFCCQRNGKLKSTTVRASTVIVAIYHALFSSARTFSQNKAWIGLRKLVHNREEGFDKLICFCPVISLLIGEAARRLPLHALQRNSPDALASCWDNTLRLRGRMERAIGHFGSEWRTERPRAEDVS